ncbi:hypothetical protein DEF23_09825 [Marinitenerispora sediminis]|uniref:Uncharacterized protein n=2 Tax=Marinitenerispora sediminis TaxID=1931232 RepID=A0A368T8L2_9ACTN|nr:hypothetical protein DEF28_00960 [Marinitenerispora sediminis]RCV57898.1 hypothetical protein DEF23_09825 [Marinitenerispora sediminis]RCV60651.1 hypothetical protein DEF24_06555 [Marinitenerispora sediminis]
MLAHLAAELRKRGRRTLIALSNTDHPVLYTVLADGRRVAVLVAEHHGTWWYVWGRAGQASAGSPELAARMIDPSEQGNVTDLSRHRARLGARVPAVIAASELTAVA